MSRYQQYPVVDPEGVRGRVLTTSRFLDDGQNKLVRLDEGREFLVASDLLEPAEDNGFRLRVPVRQILSLQTEERAADATGPGIFRPNESRPNEQVIPLIEERLQVEAHPVQTGSVRVHKHVDQAESVVDEPLTEQTWDIERVPVNRVLTGAPPEPRHEGDTLVLPVLEEVLVVEKRLVLREEVRITRKQREFREPQTYTVRRERLEVERAR